MAQPSGIIFYTFVMTIHTLEQAEKYFNIENVDNIEILKRRYKDINPITQRIVIILNYIAFKKVLIKYDLIENGNNVLIFWKNTPTPRSPW